MDNRKYQSGAAGSPPTAPASPSSGYPTNGNPGTGTPATLPGEFWFHKVGEEIRAVITNAGLTPTDADITQLLQGIRKAPRKKVIQITKDLTTAGSVATTGVGFKPRSLFAIACVSASATMAFGVSDGTTEGGLRDDSGVAGTYKPNLTAMLIFGNGANNTGASITSFDADGFTLNWTKTGTGATGSANIIVMCEE
jgi:hypothetical protein